jgi:hypothetical protein
MHLPLVLFLALILALVPASLPGFAAEPFTPQYLLFQFFLGGPEPRSGIFHKNRSKDDILRMARDAANAARPARSDPNRILGFAIGPIAMDQGEDDVRSVIRDAFDIALTTNMAVLLHLDDYMFTKQARSADGRLLHAIQGTEEWKDWSGTPAGALEIGWMIPGAKLAPPLCYESTPVKNFVDYWTKDVIGQEIKKQFDKLVQAGKAELFAGVIAGWESNVIYGYCSLSQLGYSVQNPPADFDHERERVLQRYAERWAKGVYESGIPRQLIFTHLAPTPKGDYEMMSALLSRELIRQMPQSTAFRAFWTAFNSYSNPGFSAYVSEGRFDEIYDAVRRYGRGSWAMAEGTNVTLKAGYEGGAAPSPLDWETYLARSFSHGARVVDIYGGFQGDAGNFQRSTEGKEAIAAYQKFLSGDHLVEDQKKK